jgi:polyisoprenyl-phosphate glycosyltransferase
MLRKRKLSAKELATRVMDSKRTEQIRITCIVPAYNEEQRIIRVLDCLEDYPLFDEILVLNDGSTDETGTIVAETFPLHKQIKLINNEQNMGKTATVLRGIELAKGDIIVLIDADLIGLSHRNIDKLLYYILCENYSMTILDRASDRAKLIGGWSNLTRFWGGERAFLKSDIQNIDFNLDKKYGYLLEAELNLYCINNKKNVISIYCDNLYTIYKNKKMGYIEGLLKDLTMYKSIYKRLKLKNLYKHFKYIEEDRIIGLYTFRKQKNVHMSFLTAIIGILAAIGTFFVLNAKKKKKD